MNILSPRFFLIGFLTLCSTYVSAYKPHIHEQLTAISARAVNHCLKIMDDPLYSPSLAFTSGGTEESSNEIASLQYHNAAEDDFTVSRLFNWHFYNPAVREFRYFKIKIWFIEIIYGPDRSLERIYRDAGNLGTSIIHRMRSLRSRPSILHQTGRALHYIQDQTTPAHATPVYHAAIVRDNIDPYPLAEDLSSKIIESLSTEKCRIMADQHEYSAVNDYQRSSNDLATMWYILEETSSFTRTLIQQSICPGSPSWSDLFWAKPPKAHQEDILSSRYWGAYTGERYTGLLHNHDRFGNIPLPECTSYREFVDKLHVAAIHAGMKMLFWSLRKIQYPDDYQLNTSTPQIAENVNKVFSAKPSRRPHEISGRADIFPPPMKEKMRQIADNFEKMLSPEPQPQYGDLLQQQLDLSEQLLNDFEQYDTEHNTSGAPTAKRMRDMFAGLLSARNTKSDSGELLISQEIPAINDEMEAFFNGSSKSGSSDVIAQSIVPRVVDHEAASAPGVLIGKGAMDTKQNWQPATAIGGWSKDSYQCIFVGSNEFVFAAAIQFNKAGDMWCIPK